MRLAAVNRLTKSLTRQLGHAGNEETAVNQINRRNTAQMSPLPVTQKVPESPLSKKDLTVLFKASVCVL